MQNMLSDSYAMSLLQEASEHRRQSLVSEACRRWNTHPDKCKPDHNIANLLNMCNLLFCNSMENLDRKFDKMLSLQVLDKSKAIAHILQEVHVSGAHFTILKMFCII